MGNFGLWVRYGGHPVTEEQVNFAAGHYSVAILQPREAWAARRLKELNPQMVVLCYKCLSSARAYEEQPPFTSGVSFAEAQSAESVREPLLARRISGELIEWLGYPGHFQMRVWDSRYRKLWIKNVLSELVDSPFDGVMADNDIHGDYYGLNTPIQGAQSLDCLRRGVDRLIREAGQALNRQGKILVPNIAEARCDRGKWVRHSAYGGGFEEVFLGWGASDYLDVPSALAQCQQMSRDFAPVTLSIPGQKYRKVPRLTLLRASTDGSDAHPNFLAALAALWVFGAGRWTALAAGGHDMHNGTPWRQELSWNLGTPLGEVSGERGAFVRCFSGGWAAVNITDHTSGELAVPAGMASAAGPSPRHLVLEAHRGVVFRRLSF